MNMLRTLSPRNWRLRSRLLAMLLVFTLIPLLVVDILSIQQSSNALTNAISADYDSSAQSRAYRIAEVFIEQVRLMKLLSANDVLFQTVRTSNSNYTANAEMAHADVEAAEKGWLTASDESNVVRSVVDNSVASDLRSFLSQVPGMVDVILTDKYGAVIASTRRMSHVDMYHEEWWQGAWSNGDGATYFKPGALDRQGEGQGIIFAIPVVSSTTDQPIGILRASYRFSLLQDILSPYVSDELPNTLVVDHANIVVASTETAYIGLQAPVATGMVGANAYYSANTLDGNSDELFFANRELPMINNMAAIGDLGWRVMVVQERSIAFAPVWSQIIGALIAGAVVLVTALGAAFFFGHLLSAPLTRLAALAKAGDLGQIAALPAHSGGDEIALFATSLRGLAHRLIMSQDEIIAVNHGLEQTVAKRTTELQRMVDEQDELLATQRQLLAQIADMSIPVLPVIKGVVVIPLIGSVDSNRASLLADRLLAGVEQEHARVILLDITGVPIVDSQVAAALLQAIHAAQLLGAQTILVGVRPEIAQALVSLGIDLGDVATTASLQEGLRRAQAAVRQHVILV